MHIVTNFYYNHPKLTLCYTVVDSHACYSHNDTSGFIKHLHKPLSDIEYLIIISDYSIFYVMGAPFYSNIRITAFSVSI